MESPFSRILVCPGVKHRIFSERLPGYKIMAKVGQVAERGCSICLILLGDAQWTGLMESGLRHFERSCGLLPKRFNPQTGMKRRTKRTKNIKQLS
jgi:hypothetical protein